VDLDEHCSIDLDANGLGAGKAAGDGAPREYREIVGAGRQPVDRQRKAGAAELIAVDGGNVRPLSTGPILRWKRDDADD
jgi:hypothetical protein